MDKQRRRQLHQHNMQNVYTLVMLSDGTTSGSKNLTNKTGLMSITMVLTVCYISCTSQSRQL